MVNIDTQVSYLPKNTNIIFKKNKGKKNENVDLIKSKCKYPLVTFFMFLIVCLYIFLLDLFKLLQK